MPHTQKFENFPFAAIIGQEEMKLALQLNVIDPRIGGVMIMGDRGTGKSTTIRALVDLLPDILVVRNDPFNANPKQFQSIKVHETEFIKIPMIELPLGTTEDRLCGSINLKEVLFGGANTFEPGLLARANRGLLYVDEINLLDDHLVDILLDSAASGWNTVEREGISIKHPAEFILIGSGNPEEGELRPQLLDRFGMYSEISTTRDPKLRAKIIKERISFDESPEFWAKKYKNESREIQARILNAQGILDRVQLSIDYQLKISKFCSKAGIEGLRGDIALTRAARALAAFENRLEVSLEDIKKNVSLCLRHRLSKDWSNDLNCKQKINELFLTVFN